MRQPSIPGDLPPSTKVPRSTDDLLKGLRRVLADLMHSDALGRGDVEEALAHLTEVSAQVMRVGRASVWRFRNARSELVCSDLYELGSDKHTSGAVLRARETPRYFAALAEERSIAAADARRDPRTSEFVDGYLIPLGIGSMLDAPVFLQGKLVGVVCHEHLGPPRTWLPWEELVAGTFADFVGMVLGAAERNAQAAELERYKNELEARVAERTKRLGESEASVRRLFNAAPVGMVLARTEGNTLLATNRRARALLGLTNALAEPGQPVDFWCSPGDRERLTASLDTHGAVDNFETELRRPDGTTFWADISAQAMPFEGAAAMLYGIHDVTQQKQIEEQLRELATTDALTGTLNRRHFFEVAEEELERATRYGKDTALFMLDADDFKSVNDRFGHLVGDQVLASMGATIRREIRRFDVVGRYGGEELVVLLPETRIQAATVTAERIRVAVSQRTVDAGGEPLTTTISIGVVARRTGEPLADLIRRADEAVYAAKAAGKNRVVSR
jgi:diguanylate cyclase (GGDEF)-like protein/PAS domain S-box-containing protein